MTMQSTKNSVRAGLLTIALLCSACASNLPTVPAGAQAVSVTGEALYPAEPSARLLEQLDEARRDYQNNPNDADNIIWYGRRTAYTGDFRGAIEIFSEGIDKFPRDARMYRHRGHRYISIREFERAIDDYEVAVTLIEGTENEVEPDGAPNALNIPVSSLHGNIWYHLGLAYYLVQDWENAYRAYKAGFDAGRNDDNRVSTTHWMYSILRRDGKPEAARAVLEPITADMNVIENMSYHNLCLFYKGEITLEELIGDNEDTSAAAAVMYGAANWHYYTGETDKAKEMLEALTSTNSWASFGFIAAEVDLAENY